MEIKEELMEIINADKLKMEKIGDTLKIRYLQNLNDEEITRLSIRTKCHTWNISFLHKLQTISIINLK